MASENFMDRFRTFFGLRPEPPRNDFRNPIWGSDDDDDGDELYTRQQNIEVYGEVDIHRELAKQMQDMFKTFGSIFGDMKSFFHDEDLDPFSTIQAPPNTDSFNGNNIRDYYLKPGYHSHKLEEQKDIDLDGKVSSQEMSGLLKRNDGDGTVIPFNGSLVPGQSFCQTVITSSIRKPDGTVETRRIVKSGNEVIEETTTSAGPDSRNPHASGRNKANT